jgi:hypothetical protein
MLPRISAQILLAFGEPAHDPAPPLPPACPRPAGIELACSQMLWTPEGQPG